MYVTLPTIATTPARQKAATTPTPAQQPVRQFAPAATLFREGDTATRIYEVRSGVLRLTRVLENGRRQVIAFALPGDIVGFPNGDQHHTDCDALTQADVTVYSRAALESGQGDPATHRRLLMAALREISAMQDHFLMLARKSAVEKVASFICVLAERTGLRQGSSVTIDLAMKRADIADFLGLTIETVSRTLTQLRLQGMISLPNAQSVCVLNLCLLKGAAESA